MTTLNEFLERWELETIFDSLEKRGVTTITHFANLSGKDVETLNVTEPQKQKLAYLMKKARCAVEGVDAFVQSRIEYPLVAKIEKNVNDGSNERKRKKKKKKARLRPYSSPPPPPPPPLPSSPPLLNLPRSLPTTELFVAKTPPTTSLVQRCSSSPELRRKLAKQERLLKQLLNEREQNYKARNMKSPPLATPPGNFVSDCPSLNRQCISASSPCSSDLEETSLRALRVSSEVNTGEGSTNIKNEMSSSATMPLQLPSTSILLPSCQNLKPGPLSIAFTTKVASPQSSASSPMTPPPPSTPAPPPPPTPLALVPHSATRFNSKNQFRTPSPVTTGKKPSTDNTMDSRGTEISNERGSRSITSVRSRIRKNRHNDTKKKSHESFSRLRAKHKAATHECLKFLQVSMDLNKVLDKQTSREARFKYAEGMSEFLIKEENVVAALQEELACFSREQKAQRNLDVMSSPATRRNKD